MWQIAAVVRSGVNVDAMGRAADNLLHEQVGNSTSQGTFGGSGERTVQVSAIWEIARALDETEGVDHRGREQGSFQVYHALVAKQSPDDFNAVDLVTVDG